MKPEASDRATATSPLKRRGVLLGSGAVALAGVAATIASRADRGEETQAVAAAAREHDAADGYRLTDHVRRYYETIRV